jgi:ElaA protein
VGDRPYRLVAGTEITATDLYALLALRVDVFVVEQECPYHELDGRDLLASTLHLWVDDERGPRAGLRLLDDPQGRRIGRVVTRKDQRGLGLGRQIMEWAHEVTGSHVTVLDGQSHLRAFYEGLGYEVTGPEFIEDGIPHVPMRRTPAANAG